MVERNNLHTDQNDIIGRLALVPVPGGWAPAHLARQLQQSDAALSGSRITGSDRECGATRNDGTQPVVREGRVVNSARDQIAPTTVEAESRPASAGDPDDQPPLRAAAGPATEAGPQPPDCTQRQQWNSWTWQMRNRIRSFSDLTARYPGLRVTDSMLAAEACFPLAITPYYASLIRRLEAADPIYRMSVPDGQELNDPPFLADDPLSEDADMPVPGLVHRYRDRALLICTTACGSYCRHCTRKRVAGQSETCLTSIRLAQATEYLSVHPEIHDVILSGGDPLTMKTAALERILKAIRQVPHIDVIRIGSRTPVVLPMRITSELTDMLKRYHPVYINTHFNHPVELTPDAEEACRRLADAGVVLGNQTVLLRGVNDSAPLLADLFRRLVRVRVRPYYLFQCDLVRGVEHFRTPLAKGIEIMEYLRGRLSGLAIPSFVVDTPGGGGKLPLLPTYAISHSPTHTVLRNYEGRLVSYPEPQADWPAEADGAAAPATPYGVWGLATGRSSAAPRKARRAASRRPWHSSPPSP